MRRQVFGAGVVATGGGDQLRADQVLRRFAADSHEPYGDVGFTPAQVENVIRHQDFQIDVRIALREQNEVRHDQVSRDDVGRGQADFAAQFRIAAVELPFGC